MAVIEIYREPGWTNKFSNYRVFIDGLEVGRLRERKLGRYEVSSGLHEVELRIQWKASPAVQVRVREDHPAQLRCGPNGFLSIFGKRDRYLWLEPTGE